MFRPVKQLLPISMHFNWYESYLWLHNGCISNFPLYLSCSHSFSAFNISMEIVTEKSLLCSRIFPIETKQISHHIVFQSVCLYVDSKHIFSIFVMHLFLASNTHLYISLTFYVALLLSFSCVSLSSQIISLNWKPFANAELFLYLSYLIYTHNIYIYLPYFITLFPLECAERERYRITWHNKGGSL